MNPISHKRGLLALSPLALFLCIYVTTAVVAGDFYRVPVTVAFLASSVYAMTISSAKSIQQDIEIFSRGASEPNILLMVWIFILAGAFANSAGEMGAIDSTVGLVLKLLPDRLVPAGIFIGACFISLSVGTSVGTIVALVPVASGIAQATGSDPALITAIVVGGAFFGDNLSFISDTTIAATRTQGCAMSDKFRANLRIVLPAAIVALLFYLFYGIENVPAEIRATEISPLRILPYLVVLVCAIGGMNVSMVLVLGIVSTGIIGVGTGAFDLLQWSESLGAGIVNMGELIIVTLLAGGLLGLIRHNGGIDYIIQVLTRRIHGRRGAELSIAALVSVANVCTANNTIAIITVGSLSADIARRFGVDPSKSASILDTFSCVVQGMLPYGAQLLIACKLASVSPMAIITHLYYPMAVAVCAFAGIAIKGRRRASNKYK